MKLQLAIIVVNWNGGEFLRRSLESVSRFPPHLDYEIIVVDNASTDGSREWLASLGDRIRLIANAENVGFGRANNQAFAATEAPMLFLLNSDAELQEGAIDRLIATLGEDEHIGVVGPRLINSDGTLQPSVWRNPLTPVEMITTAFSLYKLMPRRMRGDLLLGFHWDHAKRRRAQMLSGAALLVRRKVIESVGGFDESFHMYGEDNEWAMRIVRGGWWMLFEPDATVMHHQGQSSARRWSTLEKRQKEYEGFFRFQRLHLSRRLAIANLLTGYGLALVRNAWLALRRQPLEEPRLVRHLYETELRRTLFARNTSAEVPAQVAKRLL